MLDILSILKDCEALLEGHFLLSSGRHSDKYFQCARLLQHPDKAAAVLAPIAEQIGGAIRSGRLQVDAVAGPAIGGIIPAYELGRLLGLPAFFTERDGGGVMTLRRGFTAAPNTHILICEDVVTTGRSSSECAAALQASGAVVSALACIVDRRENAAVNPLGLPFFAAVRVEAGNWPPETCRLCKQGIPAVKPGSRKI
ncbi:MAG: orotate phosphoribosyltransferase [Spirochaetaceae bacterium]|jgi:orotate phosphoribosyltransferase|nr:orotate phosphoribosyltransferase [Spirochaetaceae bacterium]